MRRSLALTAAVLVIGGGTAGARAPAGDVRTESKPYVGAQAFLLGYAGSPNAYVGDCDPRADQGCVRFELRRKDRYFTLTIHDDSGLPVYAVAFAPDGSEVGEACGETSQPLASPGAYVDVWLTYGSCYESPSPSVPTTGTVEASFARSRSEL